jgi:hypothetical protein
MSIQSFWKPIKSRKIKAIRNYGMPNLNKYPSRTSQENKLIKINPYGDKDGDGVMNYFDCKPLDKTQDSKMLRREVAERIFGAAYYSGLPPETNKKSRMGKDLVESTKIATHQRVRKINEEYKKLVQGNSFIRGKHAYPKYRKGTYKVVTPADIVKVLAKNPDLIKTAEEVKWSMSPTDDLHRGTLGKYSKNDDAYDRIRLRKRQIEITPAMPKKSNLTHTIKHEIAHHKQWKQSYEHDPNEWRHPIKDEKGKDVWPMSWEQTEKEGEEDLKRYNQIRYAEHKVRMVKLRLKKGVPPMTEEYIKGMFTPATELPWKKRPIEIDAERRARAPHARELAKMGGPQPQALQKLPKVPVPKPPVKTIYSWQKEDEYVHPSEYKGKGYYGRGTGHFGTGNYGYITKERALAGKHIYENRQGKPILLKMDIVNPLIVKDTGEKEHGGLSGDNFHQALKEIERINPKTKKIEERFLETTYERSPDEIIKAFEKQGVYGVTVDELIKANKHWKRTGEKQANYILRKRGYGGIYPPEDLNTHAYGAIKFTTKKTPMKKFEQEAYLQVPQKKKEWEMTKEEWVEAQTKRVSGQSVAKTRKLANMLHSDFVKVWKSEGKIPSLQNISQKIVQQESTPTQEYKKVEDVDKSELKRVRKIEKESQREDKQIKKLEKEATKEKQIMNKENKKAEQAKATWSKMSEYEKRQVGKVIAKEAEVPEYMQDRFAAEIAKSY